MRMSRAVLPAVAIAVAGLLAGCGQGQSIPAPAEPGPAPDSEETLAIGLVDMWRVSDAEGETADTWLRLDAGDLMLWRECGPLWGSWVATDTLFLADVYAANEACVTAGEIPRVPWLDATVGFREIDGGWELLDAARTVTATLTTDGTPPPHPDVIDHLTQAPEVTDATRTALRAPAPLPAGVDAATSADLVGRWVPADESFATDPHVTLTDDGRYEGSDGCNGASGRWAAADDGTFLATSGASTLMACDGYAAPYVISAARSVGFEGDVLVTFDSDGAELGRLARG